MFDFLISNAEPDQRRDLIYGEFPSCLGVLLLYMFANALPLMLSAIISSDHQEISLQLDQSYGALDVVFGG